MVNGDYYYFALLYTSALVQHWSVLTCAVATVSLSVYIRKSCRDDGRHAEPSVKL